MGFFELQIGDRHIRVVNAVAYRAHDRILARAVDMNGGPTATFKIGIAGPNYKSWGKRPNFFDDGDFTLSPRIKLSDFIADDYSNDGGLLAPDVRALWDYARSSTTPVITRDHFGAIMTTPWLELASRIEWAPKGNWKPDDWDTEHPGVTFHPPWPWDRFLPNKVQQYPYLTPRVFKGWFASYENCISGPCTTNPPQNPWSVDCPTCAGFGGDNNAGPALWGMSAPAGLCYVTLNTGTGGEEVLAAAIFNGATWWRTGGGVNARYSLRMGAPFCSGDFAYQLMHLLVSGGTSPWSSFKYVAILNTAESIKIVDTIPLSKVGLAFPEMLDVDWSITSYAAPTWVFPDVEGVDPPTTPEVLPFASLNITESWTNNSAVSVTVKTIGIVGYNTAAARWELLTWGPIDTPAVVRPAITFTGANWIDATKRIVLPLAFAEYTWRSGDVVNIDGVGDVEITAKISDGEIELADDINGGDGDVEDNSIDGEIEADTWKPESFKLRLTDLEGS